jgi:alkanesulfonate monooxygenase SsuD/methylene tetrahydromethanopterin reductase-like flavin-dependent oxidoreductase (luciferase family)
MFTLGITDHLEGPRDRPSAEVFAEVTDLVRRADQLGVKYAWFSEHHSHAHFGHLPTPLLMALHLASQTRKIHLGTAIICLNLHHPLDVAEQVAVADVLSGERMAVGFGSGSTPDEVRLFGQPEEDEQDRHRRFADALQAIRSAWGADGSPATILPVPAGDLAGRCWIAVNSVGSARIAGRFNFNMMYSHLRTPEQYRAYRAAYAAEGGSRLVAMNRPVFVGPGDASAFEIARPALQTLWRRFQREGKVPADMREPRQVQELCAHPINFLVGGPETVAAKLLELHRQVPFDVANLEIRWEGLSHKHICDSLERLAQIQPQGGEDSHR